jgi:hypothetical protein
VRLLRHMRTRSLAAGEPAAGLHVCLCPPPVPLVGEGRVSVLQSGGVAHACAMPVVVVTTWGGVRAPATGLPLLWASPTTALHGVLAASTPPPSRRGC